jgi:hypothetical protein
LDAVETKLYDYVHSLERKIPIGAKAIVNNHGLIGISGRLSVKLADVTKKIYFGVLFDDTLTGEINTNLLVKSKVYLVNFKIGITADGEIYVDGLLNDDLRKGYCWNITDNAEVGNFTDIDLEQLYLLS